MEDPDKGKKPDEAPVAPAITTNTKEIGINKPTPFTGDRKKVEIFIQECRVYLQVNNSTLLCPHIPYGICLPHCGIHMEYVCSMESTGMRYFE
jgi:hypothetical protein